MGSTAKSVALVHAPGEGKEHAQGDREGLAEWTRTGQDVQRTAADLIRLKDFSDTYARVHAVKCGHGVISGPFYLAGDKEAVLKHDTMHDCRGTESIGARWIRYKREGRVYHASKRSERSEAHPSTRLDPILQPAVLITHCPANNYTVPYVPDQFRFSSHCIALNHAQAPNPM